MIRNSAITSGTRSGNPAAVIIGKRLLMLGAVAIISTLPSLAQDSALQEKIAAVKQSIAANTQRLHQYQWIETTQLTLKGDQKPPQQNMCQYGPDGTVQKTQLGAPPPQPSGGRVKERLIEKKEGEMKQYMGEVKDLISMYVPPQAQRIEQAQQAGNISWNPAGGAVNLIFRNYVQPGDQMTVTFDPDTRKIVALSVNTFMSQSKDTVTLQVHMASLPDGTNFVQQTVLIDSKEQLEVTTTSSDYRTL